MQEVNSKIVRHPNNFDKFLRKEAALFKPVIPFGSFEKAKYAIYNAHGRHNFPLYFFTTTIHNTEECIEIMKFKFYSMQSSLKYCRVYKIQNGIKKLIYDNKPIDKP